jgi:hypothetical protein
MIKARFYVASIEKYATGNTRPGYADPAPIGKVVMRPVTRPTDDNVDWASSTPSGEFSMTVNGPALPAFEALLGKDVAITIEAAAD